MASVVAQLAQFSSRISTFGDLEAVHAALLAVLLPGVCDDYLTKLATNSTKQQDVQGNILEDLLHQFPFNGPHDLQLLTLRAIFTLVLQASNLVIIPLRIEFILRVTDCINN